MRRRDLLAAGAAVPFGALARPSRIRVDDEHADRARAVLAAARSFGTGGGYDRSWKGTGVPVEIEHRGERVLSASERGTYCCGFTFAAAIRALADSKAFAALGARDVRAFQKAWYGATKESAETQCAFAVERHGLGERVALDDAMVGDFVQIWRKTKKPSGHSVLLLGWLEAGDEPLGLTYLSSQGSTDGIGVAVEYFADAGVEGGRVDRERTYAARLAL